MTIDALIMLLGALVAMLPFLGFPIRIDNIIMVAIGIIVISLGIMVRRRNAAHSRPARVSNSYVESAPQAEANVHEAA